MTFEWGRSDAEIAKACNEIKGDGNFDSYGIGANALIPRPRADVPTAPVVAEAAVSTPEATVAMQPPAVGIVAVQHAE